MFPCLSVTVPTPASLLILALCLGRSYDEKVDVFSFGIVLCEVSHIAAPCAQTQWLLSTLSNPPMLQPGCPQEPQALRTWLPKAEHSINGVQFSPWLFLSELSSEYLAGFQNPQAQGSHTNQWSLY